MATVILMMDVSEVWWPAVGYYYLVTLGGLGILGLLHMCGVVRAIFVQILFLFLFSSSFTKMWIVSYALFSSCSVVAWIHCETRWGWAICSLVGRLVEGEGRRRKSDTSNADLDNSNAEDESRTTAAAVVAVVSLTGTTRSWTKVNVSRASAGNPSRTAPLPRCVAQKVSITIHYRAWQRCFRAPYIHVMPRSIPSHSTWKAMRSPF